MSKKPVSKAEKRLLAQKTFYTLVIVFSFAAFILLALSYYLPDISFWLMIPLPAFIMVLALVYPAAYGWPFVDKALEAEVDHRKAAEDSDGQDDFFADGPEELPLKELDPLAKDTNWKDDLI
ncbi:MAG: hypothetical protein AAF828_10990 [Bacteroidota bacterium]